MRKYLIIGVSLFLLALISLNTSAITASQLGANQIVNTVNSETAVIRFYLDYRALTKEKSHNCGQRIGLAWLTLSSGGYGLQTTGGLVLTASDYIYVKIFS